MNALLVLTVCCLLVAAASSSTTAGQDGGGFIYDAKGKRDPFIALVREGHLVGPGSGGLVGADFSTLTLTGILWDPTGHSLALINETEVRVGDRLGEYQVQEIRPDAVVMVRDGKPIVLQLVADEGEADRQAGQGQVKGGKRR